MKNFSSFLQFGHDGYKAKDSWFVKHVEIDVPTTGRRYFVPLQCWLGKDKEDGKTSRIFSIDENKEIEYKPSMLSLFCLTLTKHLIKFSF